MLCVDCSLDETYRLVVQKYNRQNKILLRGQQLVLPPMEASWQSLSPFASTGYSEYLDVVIFDPALLAWAHYFAGELQQWGPAVGGKDWCPDRGRACRTNVGTHIVSEAASVNRRSGAYPVGCSGGRCARMPYFTRITTWGQGFHHRSIGGKHASHGCIGLFEFDAVYVNTLARQIVGKSGYGYFTENQINESLTVLVLPYEAQLPTT